MKRKLFINNSSNLISALYCFVFLLLLSSCTEQKPKLYSISAPAGEKYTFINKEGATVIPNGRLITPAGRQLTVAPHPFGLALSNDGKIAVTANSGTSPLSISIIRDLDSEPRIIQVPEGYSTDKGVLESVFMGLAITPDNKKVYVAGGQANRIFVFDLATGEKTDSVDCSKSADGELWPDGYIGDMTLTKDGNWLFAVDQMNFRLAIIDTRSMQVVKSVATGRYPFGLVLTPDEKKLYVANVGMFQYSKIGDIEKNRDIRGALDFPAFAYGSEEMIKGTSRDSVEIPGLGDPNSDLSFSVWAVSIENITDPQIVAKIKTGNLIGEPVEGIPAVGGSSPNSLAATDSYVFISNGNNDNISVIDIKTDKIVKEIFIRPHEAVKHFRGVIPFGLAVDPEHKKLFVAESGINAVGVIDIKSLEVEGHIPVGWFPSKLKVTPDNKKLIVANAKGYGSGPNGGADYNAGPEGTYIGNLMKGTVSLIDLPSDAELSSLTEKVIVNNFTITDAVTAGNERKGNPVPLYGGASESPIKHIVFISKENRTYDEVFGQVKKGNGDPTLSRYGYNASFSNKKGTKRLENITVMPNHLRLTEEFAIADNFYVDSDVSADGHRWLVNTYPNEWVETTTTASYGGNRNYNPLSKAPGSLAMNGSAGAIYPEDYNEAGSMWEHLDRNRIDFYNFGFSIMFEPSFYDNSYKYTGNKHFANFPLPAALFERTSKEYPTYNMAIPDQFRISQFIKEFNGKWGEGRDTLPQLLTIIIPNDHGADDRPEAGYPFRESYMADNDLAIGRIIEFLSHTSYWKNMAIFITEDDAQNGVDHVDAHRSILMLVSPYAKKDYVSKVHYSFGSIFKTFWNIMGLPYLNQYDAAASDLSDMFTTEPDFTPYSAISPDRRMFDPQKALDPLDEDFDWKALKESPELDKPSDMVFDQKEKPEYRLKDQKNK